MLRVDMLETLFELPALIAGQKPAARHRVAVMTTTGGGAAAVVDRLGTFGVDVVPPSDRVVDNLAQKKIIIPRTRLTDLTLAGAKKEIYSAVLNELLASDHADLVLAVVGSSAALHPQIAIEPIAEADRRGKPLAAFLAPHAETSLGLLDQRRCCRFSHAGIVRRRDPRVARLGAAARNARRRCEQKSPPPRR